MRLAMITSKWCIKKYFIIFQERESLCGKEIYVKYMCIVMEWTKQKMCVRNLLLFIFYVARWFCFQIMPHVFTFFSPLFIFLYFNPLGYLPIFFFFYFFSTWVNFVYKNKVNIYKNNKFNFLFHLRFWS